MYIDYKKTTWERVHIPDECNLSKEALIDLITSNETGNAFLWDELSSEPILEKLFETDEFLVPVENGGCATIELYDEWDTLIWDNTDEL